MTNRAELERVIGRVGDLPAMPEVVSEVLQLTDDPGAVMADVSAAISKDPALSAKILRVSNSPYYGMKHQVSTLKLALVILGVREVRNIALGVSLFDSLGGGKSDVMLASDFWRHSCLVGALCKKLGAQLEIGLQGEDFVAGLLHDIGKLVLARQLGDVYWKIYKKVEDLDGIELHDLESKALGFTHADAAAALVERWNLPKSLQDALWFHHQPPEEIAQAEDPALAAIIYLCNLASREDFAAGPTPSAQLDSVWALLDSTPNPIPAMHRGEVMAGFLNELHGSEPFKI